LRVTYFPRLEIAIKVEAIILYRDMPGQEVQISTNQNIDAINSTASILCLFRADS
jgi:hypothetical protein